MRSARHPVFQRFYMGWLLLLLAWPGQIAESQAQGVPLPPRILVQPMSLIVLAGSDATISVVMHDSSVLLTYMWRDFDAFVLGGTSNTLDFWHVEPTQIGAFSVVVTNVSGSVTSTPAYLTVVSGPCPRKPAVRAGEAVTFSVLVSGVPQSGPASFQWHFNGWDLQGATDGRLDLTHVQPSDAGAYSCTVTNAAGAVTTPQAGLSGWAGPPLVCPPLAP